MTDLSLRCRVCHGTRLHPVERIFWQSVCQGMNYPPNELALNPMSRHYIHGSKPKEQQRLSDLNGLLNRACLSELALTGGETVLDVGSGLGQFTRDMARVALPGRVLGIERDKKQLAEA